MIDIIQVRGTSGSGKTWVANQLLGNSLDDWNHHYADGLFRGRKKPLFYSQEYFEGGLPFIILGHYESNCGGCDNIGSAPDIFKTLEYIYKRFSLNERKSTERYANLTIFCEGLLLSEDQKWTKTMEETFNAHVHVFYLSTDVEECIRRVKSRREMAGNDKPLDETNTRVRVKRIDSARKKLEAAGVTCRTLSQKQLLKKIRKLHHAKG